MSEARTIPLREVLGIDLPPVEILDIGAMIEGEERFAGLVARGLASVTGFEPNRKELEKLKLRNLPARRYLPYFLGDGREATFHLSRFPGCSSLYEPDPGVIDLFTMMSATLPDGNFTVRSTETVQTIRLDDVPERPQSVDYIKLDIQGGELDVLRHATQTLKTTLVIESEVEFLPLYKNQPLFGEMQVFLREQGFVLHKFIDVGGRSYVPFASGRNPLAPISQLLWADAIFVRDVSRASELSDAQLLKMALILHDVYHSYDLVYWLVNELERRQPRGLSARYVAAASKGRFPPPIFMNPKLRP